MEQEDVVRQYKSPQNLQTRINFWEKYKSGKVRPWHKWVFDIFSKYNPTNILEVGCGVGELWAENIDKVERYQSIVLSDFSEGMLGEAKKRLAEKTNFKFGVFDVASIPYGKSSFDAVIANHMMYHVPDIHKALGEIKRVLKPDGIFFISTVTTRHRNELTGLLVEATGGKYENVGDKFNEVNGREFLKKEFEIIEEQIYKDIITGFDEMELIGYIMSLQNIQRLNDEEKEILVDRLKKQFVKNEIKEISQEFIVFVCRKIK
jgi:ubiquinone/menaquinone biosynthesis C-methylase UbiE